MSTHKFSRRKKKYQYFFIEKQNPLARTLVVYPDHTGTTSKQQSDLRLQC